MRATNNLPDNFHHLKTLDLSDSHSILWMNLAAIPLLFLFGWFFSHLIIIFRPIIPFQNGMLGFFSEFSFWELLAFLFSIILMLVLHELVHGLFFWVFTLERPKFALRSGYAFAAAPNWYLPFRNYILVGISPLVAISFLSIILSWFVVSPLVPYLLVIATFNAAGSLGDLIVVGWVLKQPKSILVKDEGDLFSTYLPD